MPTLKPMVAARCALVCSVALFCVATLKAQPAKYEDRSLQLNGLRIHYQDWMGDGQPFIMLHGIGRVSHSFDHVAPHFASRFHVYAIDMRGHGDSGWSPEGAYLVEDYVKDLEAFVEQLNLRNVVLLGNSTGGRVVQVYAGLHPERVAKLISEDVGPERTNEIASAFARRVEQEDKGWANEEELVQSLLRTGGKVAEPLQRNYAHFGSKLRASDGRLVWKRDPNLVKGFVPTELWRFVTKIQCPTLYILGGASNIVPPETQAKLKQTLSNVSIITMPGLGHYPHIESPEAYLEILSEFLK